MNDYNILEIGMMDDSELKNRTRNQMINLPKEQISRWQLFINSNRNGLEIQKSKIEDREYKQLSESIKDYVSKYTDSK